MDKLDAPHLPTSNEEERLRLLLSTYQDGTGMLVLPDGSSAPGWRDFERAVAITFKGKAQESKAIFDVLVPDAERVGVYYGISCKMRRALNDLTRTGRLSIELSNSNRKFWQYLASSGINDANYRDNPASVGIALVELVEQWHQRVSLVLGGNIDLSRSSYLVLSWNTRKLYQLHQLAVALPNPRTLNWSFPTANRLVGASTSW